MVKRVRLAHCPFT